MADNPRRISIVVKRITRRTDVSRVIKSAIIIILGLALLAVAVATRPGKREFVLHLLDARNPQGEWSRSDMDQAAALAREVTVKDRYLWTDIEHDGKVIYSGAFAHFVGRGQKLDVQIPAMADLAKIVGK